MSGRPARMKLEKEKEWRRLVTVSLSTSEIADRFEWLTISSQFAVEIHNEQLARYNASYERDKIRSAMIVPPEMIKRVGLAKKNKARAIQKKAEGRKTAEGVPPAIETGTTERVGP